MKTIDNVNEVLKDDLKSEIKEGSKLSIAAACFSIYAFQELKKELQNIEQLKIDAFELEMFFDKNILKRVLNGS